MDETYSLAPIWFTDVIGSGMMIVFSFLSVAYAMRLRRIRKYDVISTYLVWFCIGLAGFAVSRGVGHIAKRFLFMLDMKDLWLALRPYSGSVNTLAFAVLASITLFFHRVHQINTSILDDKEALEKASREVLRLNRDLEDLVKRRTHQLGATEEKYQRIFEGSMDMVFILDSDARFVDINQAGLNTLGFSRREELIGHVQLESLFSDPKDYSQLMDQLLERGFVKDKECDLKARNGVESHILLSATLRKDSVGAVSSYEAIAKDITARVQMERQLQQADKLASLGQISTGLAHEINNPLGVMLGYTQLLLRDHKAGSQIHEDLKTIEKHARNCKAIVEDLLKFARGSCTKKSHINLNESLSEVLSLLSHQFELDNVALITDLEPDLPEITADGEKLKQVFMNLLMNAKQSISGEGSIRVVSSKGPDELRISFADTGCGISPENMRKIFDPFFSTKPVGEGTGLGLSVSYGIVQDHNGKILVESNPTSGSMFTIVLPIGGNER
jgi:two-component system NtrC family sensor kinase